MARFEKNLGTALFFTKRAVYDLRTSLLRAYVLYQKNRGKRGVDPIATIAGQTHSAHASARAGQPCFGATRPARRAVRAAQAAHKNAEEGNGSKEAAQAFAIALILMILRNCLFKKQFVYMLGRFRLHLLVP